MNLALRAKFTHYFPSFIEMILLHSIYSKKTHRLGIFLVHLANLQSETSKPDN